MTNLIFAVNVHELDAGPKELSEELPASWLGRILGDTDVQPAGQEPGRLELTLTKTGVEVLVQGHLRVTVSVPCARTLDPAIYHLRPEVFLLLSPSGPQTVGTKRNRAPREKPNAGTAKATKKLQLEADLELSREEAAQDTYSGEQVILDEFLREFILLEIPMLPLREDLRDVPFEANPPLPSASDSLEKSGEKPLDPRLSPLRDLKARLEKKE